MENYDGYRIEVQNNSKNIYKIEKARKNEDGDYVLILEKNGERFDDYTGAYISGLISEGLWRIIDKSMKKYTIQEFKEQKVAVRTPTKGKFQKILNAFETNNTTFVNHAFSAYGDKTCCSYAYNNRIGYSLESFYEREGYEIIDFEQVIFEEEKQTTMEKPYSKTIEVTHEMITTHPYFRTLSETELTDVVSYMHYGGYKQIEGETSKEKVQKLMESFNQSTMERKIIGYLAPTNLYGKEIPQGTIYKVCFNKNYYEPEGKTGKEAENLVLPKEIVETWECVYEPEYKTGDYVWIKYTVEHCNGWKYGHDKDKQVLVKIKKYRDLRPDSPHKVYNVFEENGNKILFSADSGEDYIIRKATEEEIERTQQKKVVIGNKGIEVTISKNLIAADSQFIDIAFLRSLLTQLTVKKYHNLPWNEFYLQKDIRFIKIGCCLFSIQEIEKVVNTYNELNSSM